MGQPKKRPAKNAEPGSTPLDAKRRALAEEERKLQEAIAKRQRLIEDAPKIAEEQAKLRREELLARAARTEARFGPRAALQDPRHAYEASTIALGRSRRLKRERRHGMFTFFVLLLALVGVCLWFYFTVLRSGL